VRDGKLLGLFVEGTRQRSGVPGRAQAGAAMVAIQERVPVVPAAIHGSQTWRPGNFRPVSVAWGEPLDFDGLPRNAKGYREATAEIQRRIRRLWEFLGDLHELGRPDVAVPPR
jgi:1-acyl-sn-glycerol-3-phosphate acyltransferase